MSNTRAPNPAASANPAMARIAHTQIHLANVLISFSGVLGKAISIAVPATICGRSAIAAGALVLLQKLRRDTLTRVRPQDRVVLLLAGVLLAAHWITYFYAVKLSTVAVGMFTMFSFPVLTTLAEPLVFKERFAWGALVNGALVSVGMAVMVPDLDLSSGIVQGAALGFFSACCYAARNLLNRRLVGHYSPLRLMQLQAVVAALSSSPALLMVREVPPAKDLSMLLALGLVVTAGGHTLFVSSLRYFRVSSASIINSLQPLYGAALAYVLLAESPRTATLIGGGFILVAVVLEGVRSARARG